MLTMLTDAVAAVASHPLTTREALSGIWGSISLCAWIFLLVSLPHPYPVFSCIVQPLPAAIWEPAVRLVQSHIDAYRNPHATTS